MAVVTEQNSLQTLKKLIPLNLLSEEDLEQLLKTATFKKDRAGSYLFRQGDTDYHNVYLLSGKVALLENSSEVDRVAASSETARFPLGHQIPRKNSAKAIGRVEYVLIDNRKLSELLVRNNDDDYKVADLNSAISDDWMDQLLQSKVFQQIPPSNIQGVIMRMEEVEVKRGQKVVEQGGEGDYFYLIHQGRCKVTRNEDGKSKATELAKLGPGDSFGEEALLSDSPRNSTVTMLTNGNLLRLSKDDFIEFVKRPLAKGVSFEEADLLVSKGAVWLDVRMPSDYEAGHLENSVSFPLDILRYQAPNLASDQKYVICCDDGHISSTAAYLLTDRGFSVSVLEGGLRNVPKEMLVKDDAGSAESRAKVITLHPGEEVSDEQGASVDSKQQEKLKEQLAAANKRIKELGVKFQRYREKQQKEEAQQKAEVKAQQAIIDKSRIRLDELKAKREVDRRLVEQIQKESDELKLSLKDAAEQLSKSEERIANLEAVANAEQDSEQAITLERDEHKKQLHDYKQQLDNAVAERDSLENSLNELHKVHRDEVNKQTGALVKAQQQIDQFQAELVAVKAEFERSQAELEEAKSALADKDSEQLIEQLQAELVAVKAEFERSRAELEEAKSALADKDSEQLIEQLQAEVVAVKAEFERSQAELEEAKSALADKDSEQLIEQLQAELVAIKAEFERSQAELEEAKGAQVDSGAEQQIEQLQAELVAIKAEFERSQAELEEAKDALLDRDAEKKIVQLQTELVEIKEKYEQAQVELDRVTEQLEQSSEDELSTLRAEINTLTEALGEADLAYDQIREQAEEISNEKDQLLEKLRNLEREKVTPKQNKLIDDNRTSIESELFGEVYDDVVSKGLEIAEEEALRQELEDLRNSSKNWELRLNEAEKKCKNLDDALEDRDKEIDKIRLELNERQAKLAEAVEQRKESEETVSQLRSLADQGLAPNEYVDPRLAKPSQTLHMDHVVSDQPAKQFTLLWVSLGVGICFIVLEALMIFSGRGELITGMFKDGGATQNVPAVGERNTSSIPPLSMQKQNNIAPKSTSDIDRGAETVEPLWMLLEDIEFGPAMIRLKGGSFVMGSNRNQVSSDQWPAHEVKIAAFAISQTEVTFDQYDRFAQSTGRPLPNDQGWGRGNRPVINVSWEDAVAYTEWLSERTGKIYRLPSEAEWEFAIRGGSDSIYWWGYQVDEGRANCFDCGSEWDIKSTAPVASFPPNGFGLHDMAGNVREWVSDCYHPNYSGAPLDGSAWIERGCKERVVRGGAYNKTSESMLSTWRGHLKPNLSFTFTGFRVVREL